MMSKKPAFHFQTPEENRAFVADFEAQALEDCPVCGGEAGADMLRKLNMAREIELENSDLKKHLAATMRARFSSRDFWLGALWVAFVFFAVGGRF